MSDKIKANLTNHYLMFVFDFGDPEAINKEELASAIGCPIDQVFKSQRQADKAKKILGKSGFSKMLYIYFDQFQSQDGINFKNLESAIRDNKKVFLRHLGKDKVNYLGLMISIYGSLNETKKGLLGVAS